MPCKNILKCLWFYLDSIQWIHNISLKKVLAHGNRKKKHNHDNINTANCKKNYFPCRDFFFFWKKKFFSSNLRNQIMQFLIEIWCKMTRKRIFCSKSSIQILCMFRERICTILSSRCFFGDWKSQRKTKKPN